MSVWAPNGTQKKNKIRIEKGGGEDLYNTSSSIEGLPYINGRQHIKQNKGEGLPAPSVAASDNHSLDIVVDADRVSNHSFSSSLPRLRAPKDRRHRDQTGRNNEDDDKISASLHHHQQQEVDDEDDVESHDDGDDSRDPSFEAMVRKEMAKLQAEFRAQMSLQGNNIPEEGGGEEGASSKNRKKKKRKKKAVDRWRAHETNGSEMESVGSSSAGKASFLPSPSPVSSSDAARDSRSTRHRPASASSLAASGGASSVSSSLHPAVRSSAASSPALRAPSPIISAATAKARGFGLGLHSLYDSPEELQFKRKKQQEYAQALNEQVRWTTSRGGGNNTNTSSSSSRRHLSSILAAATRGDSPPSKTLDPNLLDQGASMEDELSHLNLRISRGSSSNTSSRFYLNPPREDSRRHHRRALGMHKQEYAKALDEQVLEKRQLMMMEGETSGSRLKKYAFRPIQDDFSSSSHYQSSSRLFPLSESELRREESAKKAAVYAAALREQILEKEERRQRERLEEHALIETSFMSPIKDEGRRSSTTTPLLSQARQRLVQDVYGSNTSPWKTSQQQQQHNTHAAASSTTTPLIPLPPPSTPARSSPSPPRLPPVTPASFARHGTLAHNPNLQEILDQRQRAAVEHRLALEKQIEEKRIRREKEAAVLKKEEEEIMMVMSKRAQKEEEKGLLSSHHKKKQTVVPHNHHAALKPMEGTSEWTSVKSVREWPLQVASSISSSTKFIGEGAFSPENIGGCLLASESIMIDLSQQEIEVLEEEVHREQVEWFRERRADEDIEEAGASAGLEGQEDRSDEEMRKKKERTELLSSVNGHGRGGNEFNHVEVALQGDSVERKEEAMIHHPQVRVDCDEENGQTPTTTASPSSMEEEEREFIALGSHRTKVLGDTRRRHEELLEDLAETLM